MIKILITAVLSIVSKLFTAAYAERVIATVAIVGLSKLAAMTTNEVDDDLVKEAAARLNIKPPDVT